MNAIKQSLLFLALLLAGTTTWAQMDAPKPNVFIYVEGKPYAMKSTDSQSELKKGWDIQGVKVGRKVVRYFWNAHAHQITGAQPRFAIYPRTQTLNDYALLRLKEKKTHRRLPAAALAECEYTRIDLHSFSIENLSDMGFAVTPLRPLPAGEYILVDVSQSPLNEYGDIRAYDFRVMEE